MTDLEFKDYEVTYTDAAGDQHPMTVRAYVVTEDTASELGTVKTRAGTHNVKAGDVLVETPVPTIYDVYEADAWEFRPIGE